MAQECCQQALNIAREGQFKGGEALVLRIRSSVKRLTGADLTAAKYECEEAVKICQELADIICQIEGLLELGRVTIARSHSARTVLDQLETMIKGIQITTESPLLKSFARLQRAQDAFEKGETNLLFRGENIGDIPPGLRNWLVNQGLLDEEIA